MAIEEDTLRELKLLNQNLNSLARASGSMARTTRNDGARDEADPDKRARRGSRAADTQQRAASSYDSVGKKFLRATGSLTGDIAKSKEDFRAFRDSFKEGAEAMFELKERIDKWGNSTVALTSQSTRVVAGMSRFESYLAKSAKAQSLLYSEQLKTIDGFKDFEKAAYFDELTKSLGSLNATAKKRLNLIDESTGNFKADLDLSDFKKVRSTLGEVDASIKEVLSGTGFKSLMDLAQLGPDAFKHQARGVGAGLTGPNAADINKEALAKVAGLLQSRGLYAPAANNLSVLDANGGLKGAAELNKVNWAELAKQIALLEHSFAKTNEVLDKNVDAFQDKWTRLIKSLSNTEGRAAAIDSVKKLTADFLSSGAAFKMAKDAIMKGYDELSSFNIAQIPATWAQVNKTSLELGLSFKDTVKLMEENKRVLAIYGPEQFTKSMQTMSKTFQKYGYTMQQAAEIVGPTVESAITAGINIRDPGQLNAFTDQMLGSFQQISGIVKVSAKEFATLNKSLFQSEGSFDILLGLDQQRRQAYAADLVQLRSRYVTQGLELQQANDLVQAQQQQQRGHLKDRTQDAAKALALAQVSGLGSDTSMELFNLVRKGRRSSDEQSRLTNILGQLDQASESNINAGYGPSGSGAQGDILNELRLQLGAQGQLGQIEKAGGQIVMAGQAGSQVSPAEQARAATLAKGNEQIAQLGTAVNQVSSIMNNAFVGGLIASVASLGAFTFQVSRAAALLGLGGGGIGGGGVPGIPGGRTGGRFGGVKGIGTGLAGALGGAALSYGGDYLKDGAQAGSAKQGLGIAGSVLGSAASGAATGATIGSLVPVLGTAIGAAIGGAVGTGVGLYQNWGDIQSFRGTGTPAPGMPIAMQPTQFGAAPGSAPGVPIAGINTSTSDGSLPSTLGVQDKDALAQLQLITQNLNQAVIYLQKMSELQTTTLANNPQQRAISSAFSSTPQIPSAYEFTTGKNARG